MADEKAAGETQGEGGEAPKAAKSFPAKSFFGGMEPRDIGLVVGVATILTATAASSTSTLAGLLAAAVLAGLTLWLPQGGID